MSMLAVPSQDDPSLPISRREWVAVVVATLVGFLLRAWNLGEIPPGLWYDEAINGLDALSILREPGLPLFFDTRGHPREPLFMYLELVGVLIGGTTATSLRAVSVVIGTATIPAVWWMARTIAGPRVALAVLVAMVFMRWHLHFSRLAFRTILSPLMAALVVTFLVRWFRGLGGRNLVIAGALGGLSLYTYLSMRLFLLAMAIAFLVFLVRQRARGVSCVGWKSVGGGVLAGLIVFSPLAWNYVQNPAHFTGRQDQVSLWDQGSEGFLLMARQTRDIALMGILRGDHEAKHNVPGTPRFSQAYFLGRDGRDSAASWSDARALGTAPDVHGTGYPLFDLVTGLLLYFGLGVILLRAVRGRIEEITVVLWLLLGSLASVLSFGAPNMLRLLLLSPIAALALGVGVVALHDRVARSPLGARGGMAACLVLALWFGHGELRRYFVDWPGHPETWHKFNSNFAELAREIRALPVEERPGIIRVPDFLGDAPTFRFEMDDTGVMVWGDSMRAAMMTGPGERVWYVVPVSPPFPPLLAPVQQNARAVRRMEQPDGAVWATVWEAVSVAPP